MTSKQWTDDERDAILDQVRAGTSYRTISESTGAGIATISRWATRAGIEPAGAEQVEAAVNARLVAWTHRRSQLTDRLGEIIEGLLDRVEDTESAAKDVRDHVWSAAVLIDKAQLLSGSPTSRREIHDAQGRREVVESLGDELTQRRNAKDGTTGG